MNPQKSSLFFRSSSISTSSFCFQAKLNLRLRFPYVFFFFYDSFCWTLNIDPVVRVFDLVISSMRFLHHRHTSSRSFFVFNISIRNIFMLSEIIYWIFFPYFFFFFLWTTTLMAFWIFLEHGVLFVSVCMGKCIYIVDLNIYATTH